MRPSRRILPIVVACFAFMAAAPASSSYSDPLLCIKHYESDCCGGWRANTGNHYYGGLQMDEGFMFTYGLHGQYRRRWGTADHWPVWAQLAAGHRAVEVRGYNPWPQTRYYCHV